MLAITGARVLTITKGEIDGGTILIDNGRIVGVGSGLAVPADAQMIDARGKIVMPGLIDAHSHVGIGEEGLGWAGMDVNEMTDPATPHLRAIDAINPEDQGFKDALSGGVTSVMVAPGSANIIGGEVALLKCYGRTIADMVVREPVGLKAALGENPKRVYGDQKKTPSTRMASAAVLREQIVRAQNYLDKIAHRDEDKPFERDLRMESIARVLRGEIPLRLHAHRADDIMTALRIRDEFGFPMTIEHGTEAFKIADELVRRNIPVMIGPIMTARTKVELRDRTMRAPGLLARAGVKVAIITDHWVIPIHMLILSAIMAVREGMERAEALRAVTINPAEIMGVGDRLGSLEAGKDADLQILSGDPLDALTVVERVLVNGVQVYERASA
ncbi:MAG: amidohydrolase [Chloroflexota bacterium]